MCQVVVAPFSPIWPFFVVVGLLAFIFNHTLTAVVSKISLCFPLLTEGQNLAGYQWQ